VRVIYGQAYEGETDCEEDVPDPALRLPLEPPNFLLEPLIFFLQFSDLFFGVILRYG
jgi:hypothetical protein